MWTKKKPSPDYFDELAKARERFQLATKSAGLEEEFNRLSEAERHLGVPDAGEKIRNLVFSSRLDARRELISAYRNLWQIEIAEEKRQIDVAKSWLSDNGSKSRKTQYVVWAIIGSLAVGVLAHSFGPIGAIVGFLSVLWFLKIQLDEIDVNVELARLRSLDGQLLQSLERRHLLFSDREEASGLPDSQ